MYESKAWSDNLNTLRSYINTSLNGGVLPGEKRAGQLFKDIVYMAQQGNFGSIRWALDARNADNVANIQSMILDGVKKRKAKFKKALNITTVEGWDEFVGNLEQGLKGFIEIVPL